MIRRLHLTLIPLEKLFSERCDLLVYAKLSNAADLQSDDPFDRVLTNPQAVSFPQRRPGPDHPQWKIPPSEWPTVLAQIDQGESLRQVAKDYGVPYEAIRRVLRAGCKQ